jgi:hypothetical protein
VIPLPTDTIPQELVKRSLSYSIASTILGPLFSLLILYLPISFDYQLLFLMWGFIFTILGVVSLLFYYSKPEISYGMWISRKKARSFNNREVKTGRIIQMVIMLVGSGVFLLIFIVIIIFLIP